MVGFYGVYDMLAQWQHDLVSRPRDNIAEKFLGAAPHTNRQVFFEASPISYATVNRNSTRFLLIHGTDDDIVDPATQSTAFLLALKQAGFFVRTVVIPGRRAFLRHRSGGRHELRRLCRPARAAVSCRRAQMRAGAGRPISAQNL